MANLLEPAAGLFVRDDDEDLFSRDSSGHLLRQDDPSESDYEKIVTLQIDGQTVRVPLAKPLTDANGNLVLDLEERTTPRYTTIYDAAATLYKDLGGKAKIPIPTLCHVEYMTPVAVCRLCVVQIYGQKRGKRAAERKLLPACQLHVKEGMEVFTMNDPGKDGERVRGTVKMMTEMLAADHLKPALLPEKLSEELSTYNELGIMTQRCGADVTRCQIDVFKNPNPLPASEPLAGRRKLDDSSPVFTVDHSACILCERCIRGCGEVKDNNIIGRTGKGATAGIGFDLNDAMIDSGCVQCGECMVSCPTSAITFKPVAELKHLAEDPTSEVLPTRELLADPIFTGIPPKLLLWQQGLVVRRRFRRGEVLCRQEDPGNTAFLIRSGKYNAEIYAPPTTPTQSLLGNFVTAKRKLILNVELSPKDFIFGEMSCLSGLPRSADVVAMEDGEVWELRRNVLDRLMRLPSQRERIEKQYRDRALSLTLRASDLFKNIPTKEYDEIIDFLRDRLSFVRVVPGQSICRQGEPATHFYIVRLGYVRVSISTFGTESRVIPCGPGSILGEISLLGLSRSGIIQNEEEAERMLTELLDGSDNDISKSLPPGLQTATCTALDYLELARLERSDFLEMVRRFPIVRHRLVTQSIQRLRGNRELTPLMSDYTDQGLYEARNLLAINLDRCTRCDDCTRGCISRHGEESHGIPLPRMLRDGRRFANYMIATACRSCATPHCMEGCPVDAIHRGKHLQIVIEDHCIGCGLCASNCPYGSIFIAPSQVKTTNGHAEITRPKAATCDLCDSKGERDVPAPSCVYSCPHDAAVRLSGPQLLQKVLANESSEH